MMDELKRYFDGLPTSGKVKFIVTYPFVILVLIFLNGISVASISIGEGLRFIGQFIEDGIYVIGDKVRNWYDPTDE